MYHLINGRSFPDTDVIDARDGDLVAARWTASGTHSGAWGDVAPTGRRATFYGVNIFRFGDDGKVVEIGITATTWAHGTAWCRCVCWGAKPDRTKLGAACLSGEPHTSGLRNVSYGRNRTLRTPAPFRALARDRLSAIEPGA